MDEWTIKTRDVKSLEELRGLIEERGYSHIKAGIFDVDGILRGKYMSKAKFYSALEKGFGFCDVVIGWDSNDQLYDNVSITGWHTGYPDAAVRLLPDTVRDLPGENTVLVLGEFADRAEAVCPRGTLRRVIEKSEAMGFMPYAALEYEFFVFEETPDSVRAKDYRNLKPITPGNFGYSMLRASVWSEFYENLLALSEEMDFPIEGLHTETGPGVIEAAIGVDKAMEAADKAALFKTYTKILAQKMGLMVTFMARWSTDYPGQSGHIHLSLQHPDSGSVFYDPRQPHNMSKTMSHFVGGCAQLMPEMLVMIASTVNSYSRLVPGFWAPTHSAWGVENRTTALRVIPGSEQSQRVEYRVGAADGNPYLALASALGSGLWGIENESVLGSPIEGNAYDMVHPPEAALPATLWEAAQRFKGSQAARSLMGDEFVDHFSATREWEEREFRKHVTDWELKRYFELI